jgi:hypothetical protein
VGSSGAINQWTRTDRHWPSQPHHALTDAAGNAPCCFDEPSWWDFNPDDRLRVVDNTVLRIGVHG